MNPKFNYRMKRWQEQRWLLDVIVKVVGPEFDQGRLTYLTEPVGMDMAGDASQEIC